MARFNEILVGRYNKALTKLFSMKGPPPAPQIASEIGPTIELEQVSVELRFLTSWDRFGMQIANAATPAVFSTIKFRNPTGSNVIAVFEKISITSTGNDQIDLQLVADQTNGATVIAVVAGNNLDLRSARPSSLIASRSDAAAPPQSTIIARAGNLANANYDFIANPNQEVTVNPGRAIQIVSNTANVQLSGSFFWRERLLEESERQ
jgi:hypothetical protein